MIATQRDRENTVEYVMRIISDLSDTERDHVLAELKAELRRRELHDARRAVLEWLS